MVLSIDWLNNLFFTSSTAHSIMILALTVAIGVMLSKISFKGISLGIAWILFTGLFLSHFGMTLSPEVEHFAKEFGLILFVYSIGLQVGPGFFASLKHGGLTLNLMATSIVLLGCVTTYVIHLITGANMSTMVGILYGAVTNTPGLGAAQQTFIDTTGGDPSPIAMGYAVAYPLGVVGIIFSMIILKNIFKKKVKAIDDSMEQATDVHSLHTFDLKVSNPAIFNKTLKEINQLIPVKFVVSRILKSSHETGIAAGDTIVEEGDIVRIVTSIEFEDTVISFLGEKIDTVNIPEERSVTDLVSRKIVVTKPSLNGHKIGELNIRSQYGVNITRVTRAGVDLAALFDLRLLLGDRLKVVGKEKDIEKVAAILGNSMKKLDHPNLFPIFIGIFIGVLFGSIPFMIPGIPQPIKLGLAGGPLIIAILVSRFGPYYKMVTYTTTSANMMLREIGISLFLACVGLGAGENFVSTIMNGGYWWVLYGVIITLLPLLIVGTYAIWVQKLDFCSLMGLLAGSTTDPPALAYANNISSTDRAAVAYSTVYPLTMFLRVLTAQIMILLAIGA
ncbi:MAG: putative transporter [Rikenellaceae bacterium]